MHGDADFADACVVSAFERFSYCKYAPLVRTCYPKGDGLSSVGELIDNCVLRVVIWLVGVLTISLNCVVVIGRVCFQGENPAHSLVIKNLAGQLPGFNLISKALFKPPPL